MSEDKVVAEAGFSVESLDVNQENMAEMEVRSVDNKSTGFYITLLSKDSEKAEEIADKYTNRRFRNLSKKTGLALTAAEIREQTYETLVALTVSWRAKKWVNDVPAPCSEDAVRKLYKRAYIREQVAEFIEDRANFQTR